MSLLKKIRVVLGGRKLLKQIKEAKMGKPWYQSVQIISSVVKWLSVALTLVHVAPLDQAHQDALTDTLVTAGTAIPAAVTVVTAIAAQASEIWGMRRHKETVAKVAAGVLKP